MAKGTGRRMGTGDQAALRRSPTNVRFWSMCRFVVIVANGAQPAGYQAKGRRFAVQVVPSAIGQVPSGPPLLTIVVG